MKAARSTMLTCCLLASVVVVAAYLMHPRISVTDDDAYNYIQGAYSFQTGRGYVDLNGNKLNVEPPAYSLLLSRFRSPLRAALAINYLSLGIATACIFVLAEGAGWSLILSGSVAFVLGIGFLRSISIFAKPDILNYALFLIGAVCLLDGSNARRILGGSIWGMLTPLKLVSVVFAPAILIADYLLSAERPRLRIGSYAVIIASWLMGVITIFAFNYFTAGSPTGQASADHLARRLSWAIVEFGYFFFRELLADWYGSIRRFQVLLSFGAVLVIAVKCLSTLRLRHGGNRSLFLGASIFILTWLLQFKWRFDIDPRISGYGLLLILLAFRPAKRAQRYWIAYACATAVLALGNSLTVNSMGANDPRYAPLGREIAGIDINGGQVYSNSEHLIDIQARVPSMTAHRLSDIPAGAFFLRVNLPSFDAIGQMVWPIDEPPKNWPEIAKWPDATLYRKPAVP
jgi:hypothetical protein